jgi:hypothetical protein
MAFSDNLSCPACGVALDAVSPHTRSLQCPHCGNWIYLSGSGWAAAGSFEHALDAPSMLHVGRSGVLSDREGPDRRFIVAGRLRLSYTGGYWDEWWLEFEQGTHQWLEEDDGRYRLHSPVSMSIDPSAAQAAKVGGQLTLNGAVWLVTERLEAVIAGTEGALPVAVQPGEQMTCLEMLGNGEKLSLEAGDSQVSVTRSVKIAGDRFTWNS